VADSVRSAMKKVRKLLKEQGVHEKDAETVERWRTGARNP
jgi:hypothetical protein